MKPISVQLFILLMLFHFAVSAQNENYIPPKDTFIAKHIPTASITILPLYTLQSGFRVDFDIRLAKNNWLVIGPQFYIADNKQMDLYVGVDQNLDMEGYGIEVLNKIILKQEESVKGPYAAFGLRYNYFHYKTIADNYHTSVEETNNRFGINVLFGYQLAAESRLLFDAYTGCGFQISNLSGDDNVFTESSKNMMNYNYSGPRLALGFRIGVFLN